HQALLRHLERVEVATDPPAAPAEGLDLGAAIALQGGEVVPDVGVPGRDAHEHALAAAAAQDARPAHGLRLAQGVAHDDVLALERDALLGPQALQDLAGLLEGAQPRAERRERAAVGLDLRPQPAAPGPDVDPPVRPLVDGGTLLRDTG